MGGCDVLRDVMKVMAMDGAFLAICHRGAMIEGSPERHLPPPAPRPPPRPGLLSPGHRILRAPSRSDVCQSTPASRQTEAAVEANVALRRPPTDGIDPRHQCPGYRQSSLRD